jgi:leucyl-tRNA---protein transferase
MRSVRLISPPSACSYLPDQLCQLEYDVAYTVTPDEYMERMDDGWRRIGRAVFRPACPSCRMCQSLRVPVDAFRPNRSQQRAWKANADEVTVDIGAPRLNAERVELYRRFHTYQAGAKQWPMPEPENLVALADNPFDTEEWSYRLGDRLIAIGYVDALAGGLSAIYFYYDPDERHRSLGTFNVLSVIASARSRRLRYAYLGYYVEGCRSLAYKARFKPNEVRGADGDWKPFAT